MLNYNETSKKAHETAVNHGFWDVRVSNEHCLMLVCTEISEIVEADRKGKRAQMAMFERECKSSQPLEQRARHIRYCFETFIKDSVEDEFADTFIRLCDLAGELGIDFDKMNPCRYHRAFDRFTLTENAFALVKGLSKGQIAVEKRIQFGLDFIVKWAKHEEIALDFHIREKMKYNESRPARHGKNY